METRTVTIMPPPPRPIAPEGDPRTALRTSLSDREAADTAVARCREALNRGEVLVAEAEAALSEASAAEKSTIATAGEALRAWLAGGATGERPSAQSVPHDRAAAEAAAGAAVVARDCLLRDLEEAEGRSLRAEMAVCGAIEAIVAAEAAADAGRIAELLQEAERLRDRLAGISAVFFMVPTGAPVPIRVPAAVVDQVRDRTPTPAAKSLWRDYATALRADPQARLAEPPLPEPPKAA